MMIYVKYMYFNIFLQQGYIFQHTSAKCVAFIVNNDKKKNAVVLFNNRSYELPKESISILPDCKNVIFNTAKVGFHW